MDFSGELQKAMQSNPIFYIHISGYSISVSDTTITLWVITALLIIGSLLLTRGMKTIPKGRQNLAEVVVETINSFVKGTIGNNWKPFAPYLGTVFLFLLFANIISIFDIIPTAKELYQLTHLEIFNRIPEFRLRPPTRDINVTACLAIATIVTVLYSGIRYKKPAGWLKSFVKPSPVMLPFNILDYAIRPVSLCMRLFGNILGSLIIMYLLYMVIPPVIPGIASIYFDLFDGILQAYVFVLLTSMYISEAVE